MERKCSASKRERERERASFSVIHTERTLQPTLPLFSSLSHCSRCQTFYVLFSHAWLYRIWKTCQSRVQPPPPCIPHTRLPTSSWSPFLSPPPSLSLSRLYHLGLTSRASRATVFGDISLLNEVLFPGFTHLLLHTHTSPPDHPPTLGEREKEHNSSQQSVDSKMDYFCLKSEAMCCWIMWLCRFFFFFFSCSVSGSVLMMEIWRAEKCRGTERLVPLGEEREAKGNPNMLAFIIPKSGFVVVLFLLFNSPA